MDKKATLSLMAFLLIGSILVNALQYKTYAAAELKITVVSDKKLYFLGENVQICGNLTLGDAPLPNRLVALEIDDSKNYPFTFRTLFTGTNLTDSWKVEIIRVFPGDQDGNQKYTAKRGSTIYIWIVFKNNLDASVYTAIAFTIYDAKNSPTFAAAPVEYSVPPGGPYNMSYQWTVPGDAQLGTATIYASAFSKLPKNKGIPHCPEKSQTFTIQAASAASTAASTSQLVSLQSITGNYNSSFTLPSKGLRLGNYTVSVAAGYKGLWEFFPATNTTKFEVKLQGDINDDGKVDITDLVLLIKAFGSYPGHPKWNINADINDDGKVDITDLVILIKHFGEYV
jgi:hypothetical protein